MIESFDISHTIDLPNLNAIFFNGEYALAAIANEEHKMKIRDRSSYDNTLLMRSKDYRQSLILIIDLPSLVSIQGGGKNVARNFGYVHLESNTLEFVRINMIDIPNLREEEIVLDMNPFYNTVEVIAESRETSLLFIF